MRILAIFLILVVFTSCSKSASDKPLTGTWQLEEVNDKSSGTSFTYEAGTTRRIRLLLNEDGSFSGNTLVNTIEGGSYTIPASQKINFGPFGMTKIAEDKLGSAFLTVLNSCYLQSVAPCSASTYSISDNRLTIKTALRYDIVMRKL
jgi:META domain